MSGMTSVTSVSSDTMTLSTSGYFFPRFSNLPSKFGNRYIPNCVRAMRTLPTGKMFTLFLFMAFTTSGDARHRQILMVVTMTGITAYNLLLVHRIRFSTLKVLTQFPVNNDTWSLNCMTQNTFIILKLSLNLLC